MATTAPLLELLDDGPGPPLGSDVVRPPGTLLLDADPALAHRLEPHELRAVAPLLRVRRLDLEPGRWAPPVCAQEAGAFGYLILDGLLLGDLAVDGRCCAELLGAGDLLRPSLAPEDTGASVEAVAGIRVLRPTTAAVLDRRASAVIGRFPALVSELLDRTVERAATLRFQLALTQVCGVDERVRLLLWHFADRWGRVTPEGVVVTLDLTHDMLGRMVGARRPAVSSALGRLTRDGAVARRGPDWLLTISHRPAACVL